MNKNGFNIIDSFTKSPAEMSPVELALWLQRQGGTSFSLSASVPADNGAVIANPMMGVEATAPSGWNQLLSSSITSVDTGAGTITGILAGVFYPLKAGIHLPFFDSNQVCRGILQVDSITTTVNYTLVSDQYAGFIATGRATTVHPSAGGYLYNQEYGITVCRHSFKWTDIEPDAKGTIDWSLVELATRITAVRELNLIGWGKTIQSALTLSLDSPSSSAHTNLPTWLMTAISSDGTAYSIDASTKGFSPNYANTTLVSEHERLINLLAARYAATLLNFSLAYVKIGSIGFWGELHTGTSATGLTLMPSNATVNLYLGHYATAFGASNCKTRRSIGDSGTLGMANYCDGFHVKGQVFAIAHGSVDALDLGATDDYSIAQAAITDWRLRHRAVEPYGTYQSAPTSSAYGDEPASLITEISPTWEAGRYSTTVGGSKVVDAKYWRTATYVACAGNTTYRMSQRPSTYPWGTGYSVRIYETNDAGTLTAYTASALNDRSTFTTNAASTRLYVAITRQSNPIPDATADDVLRCKPRIYLDSASGYGDERNITLTNWMLGEYAPSLLADNMSIWRSATPGTSTQANCEAVIKKLGYRFRPTAITISGTTISITIANDGIALPACGERRLKVGLFTGTTLVKSWESSVRVDDIAENGGTKSVDVSLSKVKRGDYIVAIGLCVPGATPDISLPATALTGEWYTIGTVTVS